MGWNPRNKGQPCKDFLGRIILINDYVVYPQAAGKYTVFGRGIVKAVDQRKQWVMVEVQEIKYKVLKAPFIKTLKCHDVVIYKRD